MRGTGSISQQKLEEQDESDEDIKQFKADQAGTGGKFSLPADDSGEEDHPGVVPLVKHPEFVYGGHWARTKTVATLIPEEAKTDACHATTILHLDGGQVMMAWFGGTYEGAEDVGIWIARRDKDGWDTPHLAAKIFRDAPYHGKNLKHNGPYLKAEPAREGREPHWNPVLWCKGAGNGDGDGAGNGVCKGDISLYFKVGWKIPEWESYVTHSTDHGATWSNPEPVVPGDHGGRGPVKNKIVVLQDNTWAAPASLEGPKAGFGRKRVWRSFVDLSEDQGHTWTKGPEMMPEEAGWGSIQPTIWESRPGHVHMLTRSSRGSRAPVWRADSVDGGRTWGKMYRTKLPNNNSGLDVCKLPLSGTLVLAYNPTTEDRFPLQLAISTDNGATWNLGYNVETESGGVKEGHEYSYPACVPWPANAPEEGVSVSWTWHRQRPVYLSLSLTQLKELSKPIHF